MNCNNTVPSKEYPETHQQGNVSIEQDMKMGMYKDKDVGIQIATDGRIWVCIDGVALLRFRPEKGE